MDNKSMNDKAASPERGTPIDETVAKAMQRCDPTAADYLGAGPASYIVPLVARIAELTEELTRGYEKLQDGTLHVGWCNALHSDPVGVGICSCPLGRKIKNAEHRAERTEEERDAAKADLASERDLLAHFRKVVDTGLMSHLGHSELAGRVRMATHNDLMLEPLVTAARDRILWLADKLHDSDTRLQAAEGIVRELVRLNDASMFKHNPKWSDAWKAARLFLGSEG